MESFFGVTRYIEFGHILVLEIIYFDIHETNKLINFIINKILFIRYGFCSKIQGLEMDSGVSQNILPNKSELNFGSYSTKILGNLFSGDLSREVYKPITKLKPIKLRQNKLYEDISKQMNSRRLAPALLEALPSRLTNSSDQYSTPDLTYDVIDSGSQQPQSELLKKCSMLVEKTPNQYLQDHHTSTGKGVFRRKNTEKSSYNNDINCQHFVDVDLQRDCSNIIIRSPPEMSRPFDRTSSEAFYREPSMVNEFSIFYMQNKLSVEKTADDSDKKYDDSGYADVCLEDSSYSCDNDTEWNCQSITDFWHQTRKDFGSF